MSEELVSALSGLIDARLIEHGLLEGKAAGKGKKKAAASTPEPDEIDFDSLKTKITALVNKEGKDAAKAVLKKFKIALLSELPEAKFAKFDAALDEAMGEEAGGDGDDLFGD